MVVLKVNPSHTHLADEPRGARPAVDSVEAVDHT